MFTAVLIHGFHLQSQLVLDDKTYAWRDLAIGPEEPRCDRGRASYGVGLAYRERADAIIFSTGASEKDGLKEAEVTYREVLKSSDAIGATLGISGRALRDWLTPRVRLDVESQTTAEELERNLTWCQVRGIQRVILVTSRFHAPRALANANDARKRLGLPDMIIYASAPEDVSPAPTIFEPPTRPDRSPVWWSAILARVFGLPADLQQQAATEVGEVLARYAK